MRDVTRHRQELEREVLRFGAFRKRWQVSEGGARWVVRTAFLLCTWMAFDALIGLPPWPLFLSFVATAVFALCAFVSWFVKPCLQRPKVDSEALVIEGLHGELDNQLIGSLQLGAEVAAAGQSGVALGYSSAMAGALLAQAVERIRQTDLPALLNLSDARRLVRIAAGVLVAGAVCSIVARGFVAERAGRLADAYAVVLETIFPIRIRVEPGNVAVVRGSPTVLRVRVEGARRRTVELVRRDLATEAPEVAALPLDGCCAEFAIEPTEASFEYAFQYGAHASDVYRILVGDRPRVQAISYELTYPAYTGQPLRTLSGRMPKLHGLNGTTVLVSFAATTLLHPEMCWVEWRDSSRQPIVVAGRFGHFSFVMDRSDRATIHLTGEYGKGFEMEKPIAFDVAVQQDDPPDVRILMRQRELTMLADEAGLFGFRYVAEDDFGVAEVKLNYRIDTIDELLGRRPRDGEVVRRVEPPRDRVKDQFLKAFADLDPPLQPGDRITLHVSATDNNTEAGPAAGRSQSIEIVVVRPDLADFREKQFGFGHGPGSVLQGLHKVKRATNLLVDPETSIRTEAKQDIAKNDVRSRVAQDTWPSGAEDAVGDYFRVLSGGKQ